jgi:hypothetical protein
MSRVSKGLEFLLVRRDWLVVDAVLRNQSPQSEFPAGIFAILVSVPILNS